MFFRFSGSIVSVYLQDGNGVVRGNYLSIFLELYDGLPDPAK